MSAAVTSLGDGFMRNRCLAAAATVAVLHASSAVAAPGDAIEGRWLTQENAGVVQVSDCGGGICGYLVDSTFLKSHPDAKDAHNKNAALRDRRVKGLALFDGMMGGPRVWRGSVYNPADGGTYAGSVTLAGADTLRLQGCVVWPLCKTQTWSRVR